MQGWRISMEDAHATILDLKPGEGTDDTLTAPEKRLSFFGVYDGHGGDKVAIYTGENLHKIIAKQEALKQGNIEQAIKDGFLATDRAILNGTYSHMLTCERGVFAKCQFVLIFCG
jgi:protein phosphatase 2C family protein 2/3